jgi:hypothetical protein
MAARLARTEQSVTFTDRWNPLRQVTRDWGVFVDATETAEGWRIVVPHTGLTATVPATALRFI